MVVNSMSHPWFKQVQRTAQELQHAAEQATSQAGQMLGDLSSHIQKNTEAIVTPINSHKTQAITHQINASEITEQSLSQNTFDLNQVEEGDRLHFYGALFAIAIADGQIDKDEMEFIFSILDF